MHICASHFIVDNFIGTSVIFIRHILINKVTQIKKENTFFYSITMLEELSGSNISTTPTLIFSTNTKYYTRVADKPVTSSKVCSHITKRKIPRIMHRTNYQSEPQQELASHTPARKVKRIIKNWIITIISSVDLTRRRCRLLSRAP